MSILLETERLIVKPTTAENFEQNYALLSDPEVMRYVGTGVKTREEAREGLEKMMRHKEKHGFSIGQVYEKETGEYIGRAGIFHLELNDTQPEIEIGYVLHKKFWKQGYATELAKAFLAWGFAHLPVDKLVAVIIPENSGSRHVLEKAGMHCVGRAHCYGREVDKFEVYRDEFKLAR